jgi:AcrR family transcriptional regulator
MRAKPAAPAEIGRREANKRDKLARIRAAACDIFMRKGFDAATVREIAECAGVAFGTLFLYAEDKRDLLLLLFDDELEALTGRAGGRVDRAQPFVDQLVAFFTEFYRFFGKTPGLSRQMMREITFTGGMVAERIWMGVQRTETRLGQIIAQAQADAVIAASPPPDVVAHIVFSLYRTEIRFCLAEDPPDVEGSLAKLRQQFDIVCDGLRP